MDLEDKVIATKAVQEHLGQFSSNYVRSGIDEEVTSSTSELVGGPHRSSKLNEPLDDRVCLPNINHAGLVVADETSNWKWRASILLEENDLIYPRT